MNKGKFIVVEGLEGAGKTNAQKVVCEVLKSQNIAYITTREPGGTPIAEALRDLWKNGVAGEHTTDKVEVLMLYAARTQLVETVIRPALHQSIWVVGDRHNMSTQAYQGAGRGIDDQLLTTIKQSVLGDFEPDLTIYLAVSPEIGLKRARGRGELDRIEQQHIDFFYRTQQRYLTLVADNPKAISIDAEQPIELVSEQIRQAMAQWLAQTQA